MKKIERAYKSISKVYDKSITGDNFLLELLQKVSWGFNSHKDHSVKLLEYIPDDFSGKILDIPAGTGVLTYEKYLKLKNSHIICMDYSNEMLEIAKARFRENGISNVEFIQGDVGNIPYEEETFDIVLAMNGFHVFPDKEKAFSETRRVLKNNGYLIGCLYVKGINIITDLFVNCVHVTIGTFTPPFYTKNEIIDKLNREYKELELWNENSVICFRCKKN